MNGMKIHTTSALRQGSISIYAGESGDDAARECTE